MRTLLVVLAFSSVAPTASFADVPTKVGGGHAGRPSILAPTPSMVKGAILSSLPSYKMLSGRTLQSKAFRKFMQNPKAAGYSKLQLTPRRLRSIDNSETAFIKGNEVIVEKVNIAGPSWFKGTVPNF
jgi:hypothetical protein